MKELRTDRLRRISANSGPGGKVVWAVAEVALVFVGVLLALWVEDWSQQRHEEDLHSRYVAALVRDLDADIAAMERVIGSNRDRISTPLERAVDVFVAGRLPAADTLGFIRDVQMASYMDIPRIRDATFRDLEGSGNLRLIENLEIRASLFDYYSGRDWLDMYHEAFLATKFQTIATRVIDGIPPRFYTYAYDVTDRLPSSRRELDLQAFLADESLEGAVFMAWTVARWQEGHFVGMLEQAKQVRDALLQSSGKPIDSRGGTTGR